MKFRIHLHNMTRVLSEMCVKCFTLLLRFQEVDWRYWRQRADKRLREPPHSVRPEAFSAHRQLGWKTVRGRLCSASVYAEAVHR